jgi:hypothetical protein
MKLNSKCAALFSILLLCTFSVFPRDVAPIDPEKVVRLLDECPSWANSGSDRSKIVACCKRISEAPTDLIRAGLLLFISRHTQDASYDIAAMARLFVLNRYLLVMPTAEPNPSFFGGWEGIPQSQNTFDMQWPWSPNSEGVLILSGKYQGYSGHPFAAVEEFDQLLTKYSRRVQPL